jgi:hypothetical protein
MAAAWYLTSQKHGVSALEIATFDQDGTLWVEHRGEDLVDQLLRAGIFVDLYRIVRQALRASVESYSIIRQALRNVA